MFSLLRSTLVYTDISEDVAEHDEDFDANEWSYQDKEVYRGSLDTSYGKYSIDVYWLYDENLNRVGLAEHESDNHAIFEVLWFKDTPYGTLLQEDWTRGESIFTLMTAEAYQDSTDSDVLLKGSSRIVLPKYLIHEFPTVYECACTLSFSPNSCIQTKKKVRVTEPIFIDDYFIMYYPPPSSKVWSMLGLPPSSSEKAVAPLVAPVEPQVEPQVETRVLPQAEPPTQEGLHPLQEQTHSLQSDA